MIAFSLKNITNPDQHLYQSQPYILKMYLEPLDLERSLNVYKCPYPEQVFMPCSKIFSLFFLVFSAFTLSHFKFKDPVVV